MGICPAEKCTGCMACYNACAINAISIVQNEKGFYIPQIIEDRCVHCNKCKAACPELNPREGQQARQVLACWSKDATLRFESTSGGIFSGLATNILEQRGEVCGVVFDNDFTARHELVHSIDAMSTMRGSKYVQSRVGDVMGRCKQLLDNGKFVLFTGTPCQIAGLNNYLGRDYSNLLTVDIICHGVPSPLVFHTYLKYMEHVHQSKILQVQFRYKRPNWTVFSMRIVFENRSEYLADSFTDPYLVAFLKDYISRDCCHQCSYTTQQRQGDLTMADFWGYVSESRKMRNKEQGISLVLLNTEKGEQAFQKISKGYFSVEKSMSEAMAGNHCLSQPFAKHPDVDAFWKDFLNQCNFQDVLQKYLYPRKNNLYHQISCFIDNRSYLLPRCVRTYYDQLKQKYKVRQT